MEAWIPGHGWTTFDPTPPDPNRRRLHAAFEPRLYLDAAETFWQQWVVGYESAARAPWPTAWSRVRAVWASVGSIPFPRLGLEWYLRVAAWFWRYAVRILILLVLGASVWVLGPPLVRLLRIRSRVERVRRGQATVADATLLYERMFHLLRRRGYQKPAWFTPSEFAATLPPTQLGIAVTEFTVQYNALRFGRRTEVAPRLSTLLDELERQ